MTQQVVLVRTTLTALDPTTDNPSFTLHFEATGSNTGIDFGSLSPAIAGFLNNVATGATSAPAHYLSQELSRATNTILVECYDITGVLGGGPMGSPVDVREFQLADLATGNPLPAGISCAVEYRAEYGTDVEFGPGTRPRSRDRNRFYFGPLNTNTIAYDATSHRPYFTAAFIGDIQKSLHDLSELNNGEDNQCSLVVWSRKNASVKHAAYVTMDDRPDYQRRRSDPSPATRVTTALID